jgi:hypothetical protein
MADIQLRSYQQIAGQMIATLLAETNLTDVNPGSVFLTIIEAAASSDFSQEGKLLQLLRLRDVDKAKGVDLERLAEESGLLPSRIGAKEASVPLTISDSSFTKQSTTIFAGSVSPAAGDTILKVVDATGFSSSGTIFMGRGTSTSESIAYSSVVDTGTFWQFALSTPLTKDHLVGEEVVLSQGGDRIVPAGTIAVVPAAAGNASLDFRILRDATLFDGEDTITDIQAIATDPGEKGNVGIGKINEFSSPPFGSAVVTNEEPATSGEDSETDSELRQRIKDHVHNLGKGTQRAIISTIIGVNDTDVGKRVVSAFLREPTESGQLGVLFIDDGSSTGFQPSFSGVGEEVVVSNAAGTEQFLQLQQWPVVKAQVSSIGTEPFALDGGESLLFEVDNESEERALPNTVYRSPGVVTAQEIAETINTVFTTVEARAKDGRLFVTPVVDDPDFVRVGTPSGAINANDTIRFPTRKQFTIRLYKNDQLLEKNGQEAIVQSLIIASSPPFSSPETLQLKVDGIDGPIITITDADFDALTPSSTISGASPADFATVFNAKFIGITAAARDDGTFTITSNRGRDDSSAIEVLSGTFVGKIFSQGDSSSGKSAEFKLNRLLGQIELVDRLVESDELKAGTVNTAGFAESLAQSTFDLSSVLGTAAQMVVVPNANIEILTVSQTSSLLTFTSPISGVQRISGAVAQFSNVESDDWAHLYNLPREGIFKVKDVASDGSYVDLYDPAPVATTDTPDAITKQIVFFKTDTSSSLPQQVSFTIGASVSGAAIVTSFNDQISGAEAELLDSGKVRFKTLRLDGEGALGIPVLAGNSINLGIEPGNYESNDPHIAAIESSDLFGLPSQKITISVDDLTSPFVDVDANGTPFTVEHHNRPFMGYISHHPKLIRQPLERLTTSTMTLRNEEPFQVNGLGPDLEAVTGDAVELGEDDNQVFIIDNDPAKKTFDIPLFVEATIAAPAVPTTTQFDAADSTLELLGSSAKWLGHRFEDYRAWFRAKEDTPFSVANSEIRVTSVLFGANGTRVLFGIFYPTTPATGVSANFSVDASSGDILINALLGSGVERTIGLLPNEQVEVSFTGPVGGEYTYDIQFVTPVDLSTVLLGDIVALNDPNFSTTNQAQMKISTITNLTDVTLTYEHLSETIQNSVVTSGPNKVVFGAVPATSMRIGDKVTATSITKAVTAVNTTDTVTGFTSNTITGSSGIAFDPSGGTIDVGGTAFLYTSYTIGTGVFAGVTPDPTVTPPLVGGETITQWTLSVAIGGAYATGVGSITAGASPFTYTSYDASIGKFYGILPDPTSLVIPTDPLIQTITPVTGLVTAVNTPSDVDVTAIPAVGDGYDYDIVHSVLTSSLPPSFLAAIGDKIQVAGQVLTITGIVSTSEFDVDSVFTFSGPAAGTISRIIIEAKRALAGVNETISSSSSQGVRVFELDSGNTSQSIIDAVNNTAGINDIILASNATGSDGSGVIVKSTADELLTTDERVRLKNGESFILSTTAGSPALTLKEPLALTPEIGETFRLVPMTPQNIADHFNKKQISGLSIAADVDLVNGGRRIQVTSKVSGAVGQVNAVGGTASGVNVLTLKGASQEISATEGVVQIDRSGLQLLAPGHQIFLFQTGRAKKAWVGSTPTAVTEAEISIVSPGKGRMTFDEALAATYTYTHTGTVTWVVRQLSRSRVRYEIVSGTASVPVAPFRADDWVFIGDGTISYAGITPGQFFASSNQGFFQIRETDNLTYFDVDNDQATEEFVDANTPPFIFMPYHSALPGDQISIGDGAPFVTANKGTFIISDVDSPTAVDYDNENVVAEGPFPLGTAGVDSIRIIDQGYETYRTVRTIAPAPFDPTNIALVVVEPGYDISLLNELQGARVSLPNRLGFDTDPVPGISGYQYWIGLKRTTQRVLDGFEPDTTTFPGVRAAGVSIEAREPQIQRVSLNIKVKTKKGVALESISDTIKSSVIGLVNSLGLGVDVILSDIVCVVKETAGVDSVVLVDPELEEERITINDNAIARTSPNEVRLS